MLSAGGEGKTSLRRLRVMPTFYIPRKFVLVPFGSYYLAHLLALDGSALFTAIAACESLIAQRCYCAQQAQTPE
jgi:hypothetical protein